LVRSGCEGPLQQQPSRQLVIRRIRSVSKPNKGREFWLVVTLLPEVTAMIWRAPNLRVVPARGQPPLRG